MAKKPHDPEAGTPNPDNFNAAHVLNIAAGAKLKAEAKSAEPLTEEEAVLLADIARRLRPYDLVAYAVQVLNSTPGAVKYPGA